MNIAVYIANDETVVIHILKFGLSCGCDALVIY